MKRKIIMTLFIFIVMLYGIGTITKAFYTETDPDTIDNAKLQELRLDIPGLVPKFSATTYEYYLTVSNDITDIEITAISKNPNDNVEISGNKGLKQGLNTITISVTSEDKTKKTEYKIQVSKTANLELANTNLETLAIEDTLLYPPFDNAETNYKAEISKNTEKLNILAIPQNEKAKVQIVGNENLKTGKNIVEITVTAPNCITKKKYKIEVYKRNEEQENEYKKDQEEMQNKLEEAYKIEKLSNNANEENIEQPRNGRIGLWVGIIVVTLLVLVGVGFWYWKRNI